jgi:hypothetical protein
VSGQRGIEAKNNGVVGVLEAHRDEGDQCRHANRT